MAKSFELTLFGVVGAFALSLSSANAGSPCSPPAPNLAVSHVGGAPGEIVEVPVVGEVSSSVTGFSIAVGHDASVLRFITATPGAFIVNHAGADLNFQSLEKNAEGYAAVVAFFDISFPLTVPPTAIDPPQVLATLFYEVVPTAPSGVVSLLNRTREYGSPNPVSNVYSGAPGVPSVQPALCDGSVTVTVEVAPTLSCPAAVTLECPADTATTNTGEATGSGSCGSVTITFNDTSAPGCGSTEIITRTWTATDSCGTASCDQIITIVDTTAPVISCPGDMTLECPGDVSPSNTGEATGSDTCGDVAITFSDVSVPGSGNTETFTRTWTATDDCGNAISCDQVLTVVDTTPPEALCKNPTVSLNASGQATIDTAAVDNGSSDSCGAITLSVSPTQFFCSDLGPNSVTLTVTDENSNMSTCAATVTIVDGVPPEITCPGDLAGVANAQCLFVPGAGALGQANATDNCPAGMTVTDDAPSTFPPGTTVVTWTATDGSGNTASCSQSVTVTDETPPLIDAPAAVTLSAGSNCTASGGAALGDANASDNCPAGLVVTNNAPSSFPLGMTTVTWTATDAGGSTATATQSVTVVDDTAPTLSCPANITRAANQGSNFVPTAGIGDAVASDNCSVGGALTVTDDAPASFPPGATLVTYTATDGAGNSTSCNQTVTVVDASAPDIICPASLMVESNAGCVWVGNLGAPTVTDSDSAPEDIVVMNNAPPSFALGTTVVTWTATDGSGNTTNCSQNVTITDETPPAITAPATVTLSAGSSGCTFSGGEGALGDAEASDNCPAGLAVSRDAPTPFPVGMTTVTWTATDVAGNTASATQLVTVLDDAPPALTCPASITRAANQGSRFVPTDGIGNPVASDNCSVAPALTVTDDAPGAFPAGMTVVTYIATDAAGNTTICTQTVTVVEASAPQITCSVSVMVGTNEDCTWVGDLDPPAVTDADSSSEEITVSNDAPPSFPLGTTTVTWTAEDANGNASSCTEDVTVLDMTPPALLCPARVLASCEGSEGAEVNFDIGLSANDNCGDEAVVVCEPAPGSTFPPGSTLVTCTATDAVGNTATCSFDLVVQCTNNLVLPGDCNSDGDVDISDAICILSILFSNSGGLSLPCGDSTVRDAANIALMSWNGQSDLDLTDAISLLNWNFLGGVPHVLGTACTPIASCPSVCASP
jgi:hypothetical protein